MLLELSSGSKQNKKKCSICHHVVFLENNTDLDIICMWLWARLSIHLVFISSGKWSEWMRCSLRALPAPERDNPVILNSLRCSRISFTRPRSEEVWTCHPQLVVCSSSAVFTVFRIVLKEQPFLKGYFKIYNIFSKLVEEKGKCKEGNSTVDRMFFIGFYLVWVWVCVRVHVGGQWAHVDWISEKLIRSTLCNWEKLARD